MTTNREALRKTLVALRSSDMDDDGRLDKMCAAVGIDPDGQAPVQLPIPYNGGEVTVWDAARIGGVDKHGDGWEVCQWDCDTMTVTAENTAFFSLDLIARWAEGKAP